MASLRTQAERLRRRAVCVSPEATARLKRQEVPPDAVQRAKRRLRLEGEDLETELAVLLLPVTRGVREHPWRTLVSAAAVGMVSERLDEVSDGRLHRLALTGVRHVLRTLIARSGLNRL